MLFFQPGTLSLIVLGSAATSSRKPSLAPQIKSKLHEPTRMQTPRKQDGDWLAHCCMFS